MRAQWETSVAKKTTKKQTKKTTKRSKATGSAKSAARSTSKTTKKTTRKSTAKTAKKTTKKKTARKALSAGNPPAKAVDSLIPDKPLPKSKLKTPFSRKELEHYLKLLLEKRVDIVGDMDSMSTEALRLNDSNLSTMPLHMADIGSDNFEQELTLGLVESERRLLGEIDEALERIVDRTYGMCQATGKPIPQERLEIKPWAKYTVEAAREIERRGNNHNHY